MPRGLLYLAAFAAYLPASSLPAAAGAHDPGLLVVPFCAAFALGFPVAGLLADRMDRRVLIAGALVMLAGAGGLLALVDGTGALVGGRALEGLAAAGVPPAAQAELTRSSGDGRAGRTLGGMMIAVALATLGGPVLARALDGAAGWEAMTLALAVAVPVATAALVALRSPAAPAPGMRRRGHRAKLGAGVLAGWTVALLVLAGYWTLLTRLADILAGDGLAASDTLVSLAPLTGALGIPLVVLAARTCDRHGPRMPMLVTLVVGALAFAAAATATGAVAFVAFVGVGLAAYWAYLPVVSVQVQRSIDPEARGRAIGGLYASMWMGAAIAGVLGAVAPSWRVVVAGAAIAWLAAAAVAARGFLDRPAGAPSSSSWHPRPRALATPRPSPR